MVSRWHFLVAVVVSVFAFAGTAQATPTYLSAIDISDAGQDGFEPQVGVDGSGNVHAVWTRSDGSNLQDPVLHADAERATGARRSTSPTPARAPRSRSSTSTRRATCSSCGRAPTGRTSASRPPSRPFGGGFSAPVTVSDPGFDASRAAGGLRQLRARRSSCGSASTARTSACRRALVPPVAAGTFAERGDPVRAGPGRVQPAGRLPVPTWTRTASSSGPRSDGTKLRVQSSRRRDVVGYRAAEGSRSVAVSAGAGVQRLHSGRRTAHTGRRWRTRRATRRRGLPAC